MILRDVLEKMRKADRIVVKDKESELFNGNVIQCNFQKQLVDREIDSLYPELLGGLIVIIKRGKEPVAGKDIYETN